MSDPRMSNFEDTSTEPFELDASFWPGPELPGYPARTALAPPEPCEITGLARAPLKTWLMSCDLIGLSVLLQMPHARHKTVRVELAHIPHLVLTTPLAPLVPPLSVAAHPSPSVERLPAAVPYVVEHTGGTLSQGWTVSVLDRPEGMFLFEPVGGGLAREQDAVNSAASLPPEGNSRTGLLRVFLGRASILQVLLGADAIEFMRRTRNGQTEAKALSTSDPSASAPAPMPAPASRSGAGAQAHQAAQQPSPAADQQPQPKTAAPPSAGPPTGFAPVAPAAPMRPKPSVLHTTAEGLEAALQDQARRPVTRLGQALVAMGQLQPEQLTVIIAEQRAAPQRIPLGELLVERGLITPALLRQALTAKMGYPLVDVQVFEPQAEALRLVSKALAVRAQALPLMVRDGRLVVAVKDPSGQSEMDEIEFASRRKVVLAMAHTGLEQAIERAYGSLSSDRSQDGTQIAQDPDASDFGDLLASLEEQAEGPKVDAEEDEAVEQSDNKLVRLINSMILEAQAQGVSDIHIECQPGRQKVKIRFRRDGVLKLYLELPHTYRAAMLARIKIMCDLDISERRKPQDGKITMGKFVTGSRLELRVATIPTSGGLEDAVLRLLASSKLIALDDIGLSPDNLTRIKEVVQRPYGMFLCVGPTGSGKTTTLHSALGFINGPDRKIWTAEDPIEITQAGLRQVQVNPKIDWTFAKALRSFLRADPDVIMVGEIRDKETAQTAIESSLTGHLVLSTLHTNSAPETVTRLLDMGMDPFNFGDSLLGILAQRLVRKMCPHCRTARPATASEVDDLVGDYLHAFGAATVKPSAPELEQQWLRRFGVDRRDPSVADHSGNGQLLHYSSAGCERCSGTGFRGRVGLHELLMMGREVRQLIQTGARVDDIQRAAIDAGMRTLRQDGIEKVLAGLTSPLEVRGNTNA